MKTIGMFRSVFNLVNYGRAMRPQITFERIAGFSRVLRWFRFPF